MAAFGIGNHNLFHGDPVVVRGEKGAAGAVPRPSLRARIRKLVAGCCRCCRGSRHTYSYDENGLRWSDELHGPCDRKGRLVEHVCNACKAPIPSSPDVDRWHCID